MTRDLSGCAEPLLSLIKDKRLSLFLDYDGTLVPISEDPADAVFPESTYELLKRLSGRFKVVIISGRSLKDIRRRVGIDEITYVGNHGMEISSPSFTMRFDIGRRAEAELNSAASDLRRLALKWPGTVLEVKEVSLSLHYKTLSGESEKLFYGEAREVLDPFVSRGFLRLTGGKKIIELRSRAPWHKGSAVEWIMQRGAFRDTLPLCIGDDLTDIDSFRAVKGKGLSVFVGRREEEADYYCESTASALNLLSSILTLRSSNTGDGF